MSVEDIRSTSRCTGNLRSGGGRIGSVVIHRKEVDYTALEPELCSDDDAGHGQEQHRGPIDDGGHLILPGVNKKAMTASAKVLSKGCSGSVPTPKPRVLKVPTKEFGNSPRNGAPVLHLPKLLMSLTLYLKWITNPSRIDQIYGDTMELQEKLQD